ncbi:TPA: iron-containing redox enzyme family protein [Bacillus cereus]|nr:iron-containing redox enzyme family protein [Bacillus cereus]
MGQTLYFEQPKLRQKVEIIDKVNYIEINYHGNSIELSPSSEFQLNDIKSFLNLLDGKNTIEDLNKKLNSFNQEQIIEYINELDEHWLLEEGKKSKIEGKTGLEFAFELEDYYSFWKNYSKETELTKLILDNKASKNLLVGFAFEYYHVTRRCHEALTPAIVKSHGKTREKVFEFFIEEYRHDQLLLKSLTSLGFSQQEIENSMPLPYTNSIMNMLAKWAHSDLLSFMAGIFIFEGTDYDSLAYKNALSAYDGLPENFARYQNTHGDINIEGDHGHVTRDFFKDIEYISEEDQKRVLNNVRWLNELNLRMHQNTIDYYNNPDAVIPRSLDNLIFTK